MFDVVPDSSGRIRVPTIDRTFLLRAAGSVLITSIVYLVLFAHRSDYLGHHLAGFGATLCVLSLTYLHSSSWRPTMIVAVIVAAIAAGWVTERTVFRIAIFDPVDFMNQSLGAVLAGAAVWRDEWRGSTGAWALTIGLVTLIAGFFFAFA